MKVLGLTRRNKRLAKVLPDSDHLSSCHWRFA
jgi:hypothetical protein